MKTLLLAQGLQIDKVFRIMSAGDCGEDGDLAICQTADGDLIEAVVKSGQITEVFTGWSEL